MTRLGLPEAKLYMDYLHQITGRRINTIQEVWLSMARDWGHQSVWSVATTERLLEGVGFSHVSSQQPYGVSRHPELTGIDGRHLSEGLELATAETGIVEATK
jgi:hypothetical protein